MKNWLSVAKTDFTDLTANLVKSRAKKMGLYAQEMENARDPEQGKGMENVHVMQDILQIIALNAHKDTSTRMQVGYRRLICARLYVPRIVLFFR